MRIHELAKELGVSSKDLLAKLHELGTEVKSHMSVLDETAIGLMRREWSKTKAGNQPSQSLARPGKPATSAAKLHLPQRGDVKVSEKRAGETTDNLPVPPNGRQAKGQPARPAQHGAGVRPTDRKLKKEAPKTKPEEAREADLAPEEMTQPLVEGKVIKARGAIVVKDFAEKLGIRCNQLITELMKMNILASINERVEINIAKKIAEKHGFVLEHEKKTAEYTYVHGRQEAEKIEVEEDRPEDLMPRAPVVTFLGHVDHGKTSLLDKIRNATVAAGEYGGITQHIGAYTVDISGRSITFLDTPGHEAFTAMRARGANLTDIAVIIIAADDGIMPQTNEAIMHAKAANVSIMVAINKIDLPVANLDRVKQQLQAIDLTPEDWGGNIICCPVSALTGEGIDHLLEMILLQSEVLELKANPQCSAKGYVIEAQLESGMGPTANLLVTNGMLKIGDPIICGQHWGRVRALINDHGVKVKAALPSIPVKCLGLSGVPEAGVEFRVCSNDRTASLLSEEALAKFEGEKISVPKRVSLDDFYDQLKKHTKLELKVILKADTQGSVEAIIHSLDAIKSSKVSLHIILSGTGNITENDVMLASASNAVILGFHIAREPGVDAAARHEGVEIRLHNIIYELIDKVRDAMIGLLTPKMEEIIMGQAEVKQVFLHGKSWKVAA